ncbi:MULTISPECIES: DNA polymerase Y subunit UmuC family protein [Acidithiobacillus]|jgi:protein ImuB|uniref:DNA polymerase IV-like protein ImuB n=2 Tax=Acidithiobacillus caldus TaxID=33059 RepID=F9ZQF2_ACICS|nr:MULTISPECIES: hypothetical protein [Acidithiobacillus]AEK58369.1 conserved hypothetical protein [Acidithiobacillus caldus SM-1]OFC29609.1 hypothetical protein BAE27_14280 [Acidithiobacillus caldus]OFC36085.1 hypothetical protein BAE28_09595 [Acidithiobacillus caldus]OFC39863.1 hypothetical protein BAE29_06355 [Acidithiobacillus caldus]WMT47346.1 MAG: hypothetical protein RE468_01600 [Acidithiobacillus caldus]
MTSYYVAVYFPELDAGLWEQDEQGMAPVVLADGRHRLQQRGPMAIHCGLAPGMSLAKARALCPALRLRPERPQRRLEFLRDWAHWLYGWGPQVAILEPWSTALGVEVGSNPRWRAGRQAFLEALRARAEGGPRWRWGAAPTATGAVLLALGAADGAGWTVSRQQWAQVWPRLPLSALPAETRVQELWYSLGLGTLGDLAALDDAARAQRFGPYWGEFLQIVAGLRPDPRPYFAFPEVPRRELELVQPAVDWPALRFPLARLFRELQDMLTRAGLGARRWQLRLQGREGRFEDCLESREILSDRELFLELWQGRLQRRPWTFAAETIVLEALDTCPWQGQQRDFWREDLAERQERLLEQWQARLGPEAVYILSPWPDHRPEHAYRLLPARGRPQSWEGPDRRPLWLLPEPRALEDGDVRPHSEVERIQGGWWDGADVDRDYFLWRRGDGARCWVFRDRRRGGVFLHGYFA